MRNGVFRAGVDLPDLRPSGLAVGDGDPRYRGQGRKKQPGARLAKGGKFAAKKARSVLRSRRVQNRRNRRSPQAATPMAFRSG